MPQTSTIHWWAVCGHASFPRPSAGEFVGGYHGPSPLNEVKKGILFFFLLLKKMVADHGGDAYDPSYSRG
jgi:Ser/Thr protein kinase RdoA (MazF antagonist)